MPDESPTRKDAQELRDILRSIEERQEKERREAGAFKPGELTSEEEKFVREKGLNALNYIPQRTMQRQAEMHASSQRTRPNIRDQITNRVDGHGYILFVPLILFLAWAIARSHGWPIGIFCCVLMFAVLELSHRLSTRR